MNHISVDQADERVKQFLQSLIVDADGAILEMNGAPFLRVHPAGPIGDDERQALIDRGRELVRRAREYNRGTPAKELENEVRQAVEQVRRQNAV